MADRPIIFSGPMVRALLDGRKTQTRRVLKMRVCGGRQMHVPVDADAEFVRRAAVLPYAKGDRLYVREQCATWGKGPEPEPVSHPVVYAADDPEWQDIREEAKRIKGEWKIRPSIHMPRWASRLTLTVTDVRVQRLGEISEADAWAEGCKPGELNDRGEPFPAEEPHPKGGMIGWECACDWYADLWDSLHGPDAWDANPWVAALTFRVEHRNIDAVQP